MPPCGNLRLQSEPDLLLLRSYTVAKMLEFHQSIWSVQEVGSVCAHIHSQSRALSVPSLEQILNAMFSSVAMPVPLQSQHLHMFTADNLWEESLQFQEDGLRNWDRKNRLD